MSSSDSAAARALKQLETDLGPAFAPPESPIRTRSPVIKGVAGPTSSTPSLNGRLAVKAEREAKVQQEPIDTKQTAGSDDLRASKALLMVLYTIQGIPMGLSASIPMIMAERNVAYSVQAVFDFVSWPFSVKLAWAPVVDAVYSEAFGRRKSWLVPVQLLAGVVMLYGSLVVDEMLPKEGDVHIYSLTALFFVLYFLMATQDIAVDGWALTMLNGQEDLAGTINSIGQYLGYFIAYIGFLALNDANICNTYFRSVASDVPMMTLADFLAFFGVAIVCTTLLVAVFKKEAKTGQGDADSPPSASLSDTYKQVFRVLKLPAVRLLFLLLLTAPFSHSLNKKAFSLKLVEYGIKKEWMAAVAPCVMPLYFLTPMAMRYVRMPPLRLYLTCYALRLLLGITDIGVLMVATYDLTLSFRLGVLFMSMRAVIDATMFTSQMEFFAGISDPVIGGTYMTLLNTVANLGNSWPGPLVLTAMDWIKATGVEADPYFVLTPMLTLTGLVWILVMRQVVQQLESTTARDWCVPVEAGKSNKQV